MHTLIYMRLKGYVKELPFLDSIKYSPKISTVCVIGIVIYVSEAVIYIEILLLKQRLYIGQSIS